MIRTVAAILVGLPAMTALAQEHPDFQQTNAAVREVVNGDRPLQHATTIDEWWRWPGTPGFDNTIDLIEDNLRNSGYISESEAGHNDRLVYRVESYEQQLAWEPISATVSIVGQQSPLLTFESNRNMIAIGSGSTPEGGVELGLVDIGSPGRRDWPDVDFTGKLVLGRTHVRSMYSQAVQIRGAAGVLGYSIPGYNRAQQHKDSIPFASIGGGGRTADDAQAGFAINLSTRALERLEDALQRGPVRLHVDVQTSTRVAPERVIVAEIRGNGAANERVMLSAHVQEPGANDNASGVAAQIEIAAALATLLRNKQIDPTRTISMLWGNEISAIARFLQQDDDRRAGVKFGMSLDMVGADPEKTGGIFLIEKMPDPSAIWTRGEDQHTEWGGRLLREVDMTPHFMNDFVFNRLADQARATGWTFKSNPYEGGSDHVPFLRADIPAVLLWHFTDVYYHTDGDRAHNLSAATLANAAASAGTWAIVLASPTDEAISAIISETLAAGIARLDTEAALSATAIESGDDREEQLKIIRTWHSWYHDAIATCADIAVGSPSIEIVSAISTAQRRLDDYAGKLLRLLNAPD